MKRKMLTSLLVIFAVMLAGCSAEIVSTLPKQEVSVPSSSASLMKIEVQGGDSLELVFKPVAYAKRYAYRLDGSAIIEGNVTYRNGYCRISISGAQPSGTVELFAIGSSGAHVSIASSAYALSLDDVTPDAYLSSRDKTSAQIRVFTNIPEGSIYFYVEVMDSSGNEITTQMYETSVIEITGLEENQGYSVKVYHALTGQSIGTKSADVTIPRYDADTASTMELDVTDKGFVVSGIPGGVSSVTLHKSSAIDDKVGTDLKSASVRNGQAEIPFTSLNSLEAGYFHVEAGSSYRSNIVKYTTPLVNPEVTMNYKSVFVDFSFSMDFDASHYDIYVIGVSSAKVDVAGNHVTISNLKSNYDFGNVLLCFRYKLKENEAGSSYVISCPVELKTKSFVGTYSWENTGGIKDAPSNFIIDVRNSEDGSEFPYYVYFNRNDEAVKGTANEDKALRIMPLLDPAAGDPDGESSPIPLTGVDAAYASANASYMANSGKWNTSSFTPTKWKIISNTFANAGDGVVTTTKSWASIFGAFEMDADTATGFYFMEYQRSDGTMLPVIKFKNIGTGTWANTVNSNLVKNTTPDNGKKYGETLQSEPDPKYCWYLEKID